MEVVMIEDKFSKSRNEGEVESKRGEGKHERVYLTAYFSRQ
jgi:hypothetical protein